MIYDLIIVGGGPAGMSAGIYASRANLKTLLITKSFGGQINLKAVLIENYLGFEEISGLELIKKFEHHLKKFPIEISENTVTKIKKEKQIFTISTADKKQFQAKTVIVSSGADPRPLEIPGEKEFIGKGISYCVACDGPLFKNKTVAVIGGGNAGFEVARALATWVEKIYVLECLEQIQADESNIKAVKNSGKAEIITNIELKEIKGNNFVESLIYKDNESKETKILKVDGIFIEIGSVPATDFIKGLVDFNEIDEIKVDAKTGATNIEGLFAAGDADDVPYKQIIIAAGEGAKAAISATRYFRNLED